MADTRISALTRLPEAGVSPTDLLPIADLSASETKAITAKDLLEGVVINMDAGSIPADKIDFSSGVPSGTIDITQGDVVLGRITGAGFAEEIACTAAGRALLAGIDAAAQRTSLGLGSLALRSGSWVDGSSFSGTSSGTNTGDQTITLTGPVTGAGTGTFATTITAGAVGTTQLATGAATTIKVADDAITSAKLADQSSTVVVTGSPAGAGAFIGQGAINSVNNVTYTYTASGWVENAGAKSITFNEVNTPLSFAVSGSSALTVDVRLDLQAANRVWAGPSSGANAVPTFRALVSADLPAATAGAIGAVKPGDGLSVAADGLLTVNKASTTAIGGVSIAPGDAVTVDGAGQIAHSNSGVTPGTYPKVTVDAFGHVVSGSALDGTDVPPHDASLLVSGSIPAGRFGDKSIPANALADYATAYIQDVLPPLTGNTIGRLWLNPLAQQIRMWDGNVWVPIGVGALSEQNLRFSGLFNASDGKITILTQFGRDAGYKVGDVLPVATDQLTGSYFVCDTAGNGTAVVPGIAFDPGDWCLCLGVAQGWARIDTLSGGGGGGTTTLDGLIDVDVPNPSAGQVLEFDGTVWKAVAVADATTTVKGRIELATQAEVDAGTDAVRAVTPATLKQYVATASPPPPDATTTVKGIVQLATAADVTAGSATKGVTADLLKTTNDTLTTATNNITTIQGQITTLQGQTIDASETAKGIIELATIAEVTAGTDTVRAVTPAGAKAVYLPTDFRTLAVLP